MVLRHGLVQSEQELAALDGEGRPLDVLVNQEFADILLERCGLWRHLGGVPAEKREDCLKSGHLHLSFGLMQEGHELICAGWQCLELHGAVLRRGEHGQGSQGGKSGPVALQPIGVDRDHLINLLGGEDRMSY